MTKASQTSFEQVLPGAALYFPMAYVQGGRFDMGEVEDSHPVELSDFWMGVYPVTQDLYQAVLGHNPSYFRGLRRPVEQVSWLDAVIFCNALNERCGSEPVYFGDPEFRMPYGKANGGYEIPEDQNDKDQVIRRPGAGGYRLPTEAEWEYAARGGNQSGSYVYAGSDKLDEVGWYGGNGHNETKPVGLKLWNELGLYDMSGNVREWCEDWLSWEYYQQCAEQGVVANPTGPVEGLFRVRRGGGYFTYAGLCRPSARGDYWPARRDSLIGFRLVFLSLAGSGELSENP